jgi:hypothetical protein
MPVIRVRLGLVLYRADTGKCFSDGCLSKLVIEIVRCGRGEGYSKRNGVGMTRICGLTSQNLKFEPLFQHEFGRFPK